MCRGNLELAPQDFRRIEKLTKKCDISDIEHYYKNKNGFTLAEILITLGVIGFVVAMTMPVLIANYQKKVTVVKLKKEYSELNSVLKQAVVDYGSTSTWTDWPSDVWNKDGLSEQWVNKYIIPYTKVLKHGDIYQNSKLGLPTVVDLNGGANAATTSYSIVKPDGVIWGFMPNVNNGTGVRVHIYINIPKNKKAVLGKDVFTFVIYSSDKNIVKAWGQGHTRSELMAEGGMPNSSPQNELPNSGSCNKMGRSNSYALPGAACAALIMLDGWQIKSDYPW